MKKTLFSLFIISIIFWSCETEDDFGSNVVSSSSSTTFEELVILMNLKTTDSTYLVVSSVESVEVYINNQYWSTTSSETVDTSIVSKELDGNQYVSDTELNYLVLSQQENDNETKDFNTAGDYADYLNDVLTLEKGNYVCLIKSFIITFNDGSQRKYYPYRYTSFSVDEDSRSAVIEGVSFTL